MYRFQGAVSCQIFQVKPAANCTLVYLSITICISEAFSKLIYFISLSPAIPISRRHLECLLASQNIFFLEFHGFLYLDTLQSIY